MNQITRIELTSLPLERIPSDIAIAGFFEDERPLRGGVARADWRLCGGLSKRIEMGDLSGKSGEAMLIGTGRALRSPRLLVIGLGDRGDFDRLRLTDEVGQALARCRGLLCPSIALSPLGIAADDVPRHAPALLAGIREAQRADSDPGPGLHVSFCVPRGEIPGIARALEDARKAARADEIELLLPEVTRTPPPRAPRAAVL